MRYGFLFSLGSVALAFEVAAQSAVDVARPEQQQREKRAVEKAQEKRAKQASIIEFRGEQAFAEKELRVALKEEITTIEDFGLSPARADDLAFFLEVFYRKHGYAKVNVHYVIESGSRLRLDITEGPRFTLRRRFGQKYPICYSGLTPICAWKTCRGVSRRISKRAGITT